VIRAALVAALVGQLAGPPPAYFAADAFQLAPAIPPGPAYDGGVKVEDVVAAAEATAADAGTFLAHIYKIDEPARITVGFADPMEIPTPSYLFTEPAFSSVNAELKRLQYIEAHPPTTTVNIPLSGWVTGMVITAAVALAGGIALGYTIKK
jgi:hypothetical protein